MEQHFSRLIEKSEQYIKTTGELYKLKAIDKSAEVLASLTANLFVLISVTIFLLTLNIGIAFWLGTIIGEVYLGFFIVALFYLLLTLLIHLSKKYLIERPTKNIIINKMLTPHDNFQN
jgi:hypothetical protein